MYQIRQREHFKKEIKRVLIFIVKSLHQLRQRVIYFFIQGIKFFIKLPELIFVLFLNHFKRSQM